MKIKPEKFNPKVLLHSKGPSVQDVAEHTHGFCMIYYVLTGQATAYIDHKAYEIKKGDIVIINKDQYHGHRQTDSVLFYLAFDEFQLEGAECGIIPVTQPVITPVKYADEIYDCCRKIVDIQEKKDFGWEVLANVLSTELFIWILKEIDQSEAAEDSNTLQLVSFEKGVVVHTITEYFKAHYMEHISVDEIASSAYMSATYVTRIFKEVTGDTPINYLIGIRLEKAAELLREGKLHIQDISKAVGYEDPYYFSKLFKKRYDVSPTEYRKQYA